MIRIPRQPGLSYGLSAAFAAAALLGQASAQTIPNPGFEVDTNFTNFPGYISGNSPITGWTADPETGIGLNPSGGSPFADNGTIPQGNNVAFIQSSGGPASLSTTITGLNPGTRYRLQFRLNARNGQTGSLTVYVDESPLGVSGVYSVGGSAPYKWAGVEFDAQSTEAVLRLENSTGGDNTVVVDDFTIAPTTNDWSYESWTSDEDSGVDPAYNYTHAYSFGSGASPLINEIQFTGLPQVQPAVEGRFSTTGFSQLVNPDNGILLTGQSAVLGSAFVYNGFPSTVTLNGLTPGKDYVLSLYSVAWENAGARVITFRNENSAYTIDQDAFGDNGGIRIIHNYKADASGNATIFTHPLPNASFHLYGFTNREATPILNTAPVFAVSPQNAMAVEGDPVTLAYSVTGTRPITVEWLKNGVVIPGETGSTLVVDAANADGVVDASDTGFYSVRATNSVGTVTSAAGFVGVYVPAVGPLFSTGVDGSGIALEAGMADPHYQITSEPDGGPAVDALVQSGIPGVWVPNTPGSQWIGLTDNTSSGSLGNYVYSTAMNMAGVDLNTFLLTGRWATDDGGTSVTVNGVEVPGIPDSPAFVNYTWFEATAAELGLTAGVNTVDFHVTNGAIGYTGLRVASIKVPDGTAPVFYVTPVGGTIVSGVPVTLSAAAFGSGILKYQWTKGGSDIPGATGKTYSIPAFTQAEEGQYAVKVTNPVTTVTSPVAQLTASNVPPVVNRDPVGGEFGTRDSVTFTVGVLGSEPFTYQWQFNGNPIQGATGATFTIGSLKLTDAGAYSVNIKNAYGEDTSDSTVITVRNTLENVYNTGVDDNHVPLADGEEDPHYVLFANPQAPGAETPIQAIVEDSSVFPISDGTWLRNSETSKWVGPEFNTSGSAGEGSSDAGELPGRYGYRYTVDLTGFDPSTVEVRGKWAVDNFVDAVRVNSTVVPGVTNTAGFASYQDFTFKAPQAAFVNGINTIDFIVKNDGVAVGYTGLRIDGFKIFVEPATPSVAGPPVGISLSPTGQPVVRVTGVEGKRYRILRSTGLAPAWAEVLNQLAPAGGVVEFTDTSAPAGRAFYVVEFETP